MTIRACSVTLVAAGRAAADAGRRAAVGEQLLDREALAHLGAASTAASARIASRTVRRGA